MWLPTGSNKQRSGKNLGYYPQSDWASLAKLGKQRHNVKETQPPTHAPPVGSTAFTGGVQALTEFADREQRKNNIIIHNIAESTEDTAPLRETSDRTTIKDLVRNGTKLDDVNIEKLVSIGKRNPNRPRLLLVTLDCERTKILSNAWRLKNNTKWENTFIDPDRTLQEREEHKALRNELKSRRDAGEDNLVIRSSNCPGTEGDQKLHPSKRPTTNEQQPNNHNRTTRTSNKLTAKVQENPRANHMKTLRRLQNPKISPKNLKPPRQLEKLAVK